MIDIVTVVFDQELDVLRVQAQSIEIFAQNLGIKNIYVLVNDTDTVAKKIQPHWWGACQHKVHVLPRSVFSTDWIDNGWVSQQVLKLLASSLSYNIWSMVLDAKTLLVNPMQADMFVKGSHQLTLGTAPVLEVFQPACQIASQLFGVPITHVAQPSGVPFFFHNQTVREMIVKIGQQTDQSFPTWFQQQGMLTEFVLYSAFIKYKYGDLNQVYLDQNKIKICNNVCHSEVNLFDHKLQEAKQLRPLTMGVHRRAWTQLSPDQQQAYVAYLVGQGIDQAQILV